MRINKNKRNNLELSLVEKTNVKEIPFTLMFRVFFVVNFIVNERVHLVGV